MKPKTNKKKSEKLNGNTTGDCPAGYFRNKEGKCVPLVTPPPPDFNSNES